MPVEGTVHGLLERQADDRLALLHRVERVSLQELNERANRLAWRLRREGVRRGSVVGVCLPRSIELDAALLGVLKAGAAYLPLDPGYPEERLRFMVEDSGARLLDRDGLADEPTHDPPPVAGPDDLAYLIYTSGSTGRPKGVMGTHLGAVNRFEWMWRAYPFAEAEHAVHRTPLSFVDSVWEIFGPLLQGVPATILGDDEVRDPDAFADALAACGATRVVLVPALLEALVDRADRLPKHPMVWSVSGEALPPALAERCEQALPNVRLVNLYGSTEVAGDATCDDPAAQSRSAVTIGRPIANTHAYVLDEQLEPVPVGVVGELWLGGVGLARGYHGSPGLTADRFRPDPFSSRRGARLYRTGDLARWRADGVLEYLGRRDGQVNLRGNRVELGEIEARLREHPLVLEAAVVVREDAPERRLVAYVVGEAGPALRSFLAERLPGFMVPAVFVELPELPRTPSGKLDRGALPAPSATRTTDGYRAPQTETERELARLWAEALQLDRVGADDNFFDLGGSSLLAVQLAARITESGLPIEHPLRCLYSTPTVAAMARAAEPASA